MPDESRSNSQDAVVIRSALKCYVKGQPNILNGLNMTVTKGCIYGLLGASGCGKTTLLSCVVGVRKLDSGDVWVLGGKPGDRSSGIPGPRVGYMPQDISLVPEMSVMDSLYYFGRINGLDHSVIDDGLDFFSDLLELPPKNRLIKHCSGGQQRRVSFAAALIHRPELLILDEPTVGLDSLLREKIWNYLVKIAKEDDVTIIITTHYIEEAKQSDRIGLLRRGELLAETTPNALLQKFQCESLEDAFVSLSQQQEDNFVQNVVDDGKDDGHQMKRVATSHPPICEPSSQTDSCSSGNSIIGNDSREAPEVKLKSRRKRHARSLHGKIFQALMIKNLLQILRNPGTILFGFVSPLVQTALVFLTMGHNLRGLVVAVVNDEAGDCDSGTSLGAITLDPDEFTCQYENVSCYFLNGFDESIMVKRYYDSVDEATEAIVRGQVKGIMHFSGNFSSAFQLRRENFLDMEDEDIVASQIHTRLDMSDSQISLWLKKKLIDRFIDVHGEIVSHCNVSKLYANKPIYFEDPIYGINDPKYSDYVAPGLLVSLCFFFATALSSSTMISDRAEGVWDRSLVQGVKTWEILFSHILTGMIVISIQVGIVLLVTFTYFQVPCRGSFIFAVAIIWLSSFLGMSYGFLLSCVCTSHTLSHMLALGSFYPIIFLNGCMWPVEAMPKFLYYISLLIPATIPTFTLRSIMEKGYPLSDPEIYSGFIVGSGWSVIFIVYCVFYLKKKSSL